MKGKFLVLSTVYLFLCVSVYGFPSWMGVFGQYQRHDGKNPGTFRILLNEDYIGLNAEVFIKVNDGSWEGNTMDYVETIDGNSLWEYTPSSVFPDGEVKFYFHGYDNNNSNNHIYDSNFEQANYKIGTLIRQPYLQSLTDTSVTLCWRSVGSSNVEIKVGVTLDSLDSVYQEITSNVPTEGSTHQVSLTNLIPATKYYYAIYEDNVLKAGEDENFFFQTSIQSGKTNPFRVWVIGDAGSGDDIQKSTRDSFRSYNGSDFVNLWLMLGDNAYYDGTDEQIQLNLFNIYTDFTQKTAFYTAYGNHDSHKSNADTQKGPYFENFVLPTQAEGGGIPSHTKAYYSFDYGNVHFICYDTTQSDIGEDESPMLKWLIEDLASTKQTWKIAFAHHPPYSKGTHNSDTEADLISLREKIIPILESGRVDLALYGHSHVYERSYQIYGHYGTSDTYSPESMLINGGDGRKDGDGPYQAIGKGTIYLVTGNAGKPGGGSLNHPIMYHSADRPGTLIIDVEGSELNLKALGKNQEIYDYLTIQKPSSTLIWFGDVNQNPAQGELDPGEELHIGIHTYPVGSTTSVKIVYTADNEQTWETQDMTKESPINNQDYWTRSIGSFSEGQTIKYFFEITDTNGNKHYDNNLREDYSIRVNNTQVLLWVGDTIWSYENITGAPPPEITPSFNQITNYFTIQLDNLKIGEKYTIEQSLDLNNWMHMGNFYPSITQSKWQDEYDPNRSRSFYRVCYTADQQNLLHINTQSYPKLVGIIGEIVYTIDNGATWSTQPLEKINELGNNDIWSYQFDSFPSGTNISFAIVVKDEHGNEIWDNNGDGTNYTVTIP